MTTNEITDVAVSIRHFFEAVLGERDRRYQQRFEAQEEALVQAVSNSRETASLHATSHLREHEMTQRALDKAEDAMNRRLNGMNEVRSQLHIQAADFVRRDLLDAQVAAIQTRLEGAQTDVAAYRERLRAEVTGITTGLERGIAANREMFASVASRSELAAVADKIDALESAQDRESGRRSITTAIISLGMSVVVGLIVGMVFFLLRGH